MGSGVIVGLDVGAPVGEGVGSVVGSGDGGDDGPAVGGGVGRVVGSGVIVGAGVGTAVGVDVGTAVGTADGAHGCVSGSVTQQGVPRSVLVVTCQSVVTLLERAWTSVGTSEHSWFELRRKLEVILSSWPSWVGMLDESEFEWRLNQQLISLS